MRRPPCDNAMAGIFLKTLKVEAVYLAACGTSEDVTTDLPPAIAEVYTGR